MGRLCEIITYHLREGQILSVIGGAIANPYVNKGQSFARVRLLERLSGIPGILFRVFRESRAVRACGRNLTWRRQSDLAAALLEFRGRRKLTDLSRFRLYYTTTFLTSCLQKLGVGPKRRHVAISRLGIRRCSHTCFSFNQ